MNQVLVVSLNGAVHRVFLDAWNAHIYIEELRAADPNNIVSSKWVEVEY